jgi:hypothetical protein
MTFSTQFSQKLPSFHSRLLPESGSVVGYAALILHFNLPVPDPDRCAMISNRHKRYETELWKVFTPRHQPEESLYHQLVFALKYEGINLLFFKKLFEKLNSSEVEAIVRTESTGQYSRKIWFLYEWLMGEKLTLTDLSIKNYVPLIDSTVQFALKDGTRSSRHRIINNLPGTVDFCPLVRKTPVLEGFITQNWMGKKEAYLKRIRKDILQRASAFLLLKDSKASFTIEGESPKSKRAARWGQAIGQAGLTNLSPQELERLQQLIIENDRFTSLGFRKKGGFIGLWDKETLSPVPDHISAKYEDIDLLINGLITTSAILLEDAMDPVVAAAIIAFGFVFIHPFADGNGRIHRYLIHHVLAKKQFSQQGIIFPISAAILDRLVDYQKVLEHYSIPLLDFIDWKETPDHNVAVLNETLDYYRYFDATKQAEFLYECVRDTIETIIPKEVTYLNNFEEFKNFLDHNFEMPDSMVALLVRFLEQNNGQLSKRAREKEFTQLTAVEVNAIEVAYKEIFNE